MKCKVVLTRTVELIVEGRNEEVVMNWLRQTTPNEAYELSKRKATDLYDEDIIYDVSDNVVADYVIK